MIDWFSETMGGRLTKAVQLYYPFTNTSTKFEFPNYLSIKNSMPVTNFADGIAFSHMYKENMRSFKSLT